MRTPGRELDSWLVQRASAVYMLLFMVFFLVHFMSSPPHSYLEWHAWVTGSGVSILMTVFFAALLAHAWVGLRVVVMDYVHAIALQVGMLFLLAGGL
jgi:succinate dehydrogenase / fumarate reductase membrane anchor subunit